MVKFRQSTSKHLHKNSFFKRRVFKSQNALNSIKVPLLLGLGSLIKQTNLLLVQSAVLPLKVSGGLDRLPNKSNVTAQFFYMAALIVFSLKNEVISIKDFKFLYNFDRKTYFLFPTKSKDPLIVKNSPLNLLGQANTSLFLTFGLRQLNPTKYKKLLIFKALIGLQSSLSIKVKPLTISVSPWNLNRLIRKMQVISSLGGLSNTLFYPFVNNWYDNKSLNQNQLKLNQLQILYHIRRVNDKLEFLSDVADKNFLVKYAAALLKISRFNNSNQRLKSLKNIIRKTKHRQMNRWNIFPRNYFKTKRQVVVKFNLRKKSDLTLKLNEIN